MDQARTLHAEDLVTEIDGANHFGTVERTNGDVDTHMPYPGRGEDDYITKDSNIPKKVFNKFMKDGIPPPGYVYVRWYGLATVTLLPEARVKLVDRSFLIGDVVKRPTSDPMSGVVVNTATRCRLQPLHDVELAGHRNKRLKGFLPFGNIGGVQVSNTAAPLIDIPASELRYDEVVNDEDLFVYKDRLGRIDELVTSITLRLTDNSVVEIADDTAEHIDSAIDPFSVGDIASAKKGVLRNGKWIYGQYNPNTPPIGTVVARRIRSAEVTWLQRRIGAPDTNDPPALLDSDDLEENGFRVYDRAKYPQVQSPQRSESSVGSDIVSFSEIDIALGRRVRFKDLSGACVKYDGTTPHGKLQRIDRKDTLGYDLNVFEVVSHHTEVTIQWQDLSISKESNLNLVPDSSIIDEHAAWPGEIAHTLDFVPVDGSWHTTRPSKVGVIQTVDATQRMAKLRWCPDSQCQYFESSSDDVHKARTLLTAIMGRTNNEKEEELSLYDIEAPGDLNVRRGDIVLIMLQSDQHATENETSASTDDADWVGEIVDTCLDGSLTIRLGACKDVRDINITRECVRIAVRSDGTDQGDQWDDGEEDENEYDSEEDYDDVSEADTDADYTMALNNEDHLLARYEDQDGMPLDEDEVENEEWESDPSDDHDREDVDMIDVPEETPLTSHDATPLRSESQKDHQSSLAHTTTSISSGPPEQYALLEEIPTGHHFYNDATPESAAQMKRVAKEHKILRSPGALPAGVYVRSYESRLDLLRVLIVGPTDTPYDGAPFVVDFFLGGSFPTNPPQAFFHSWTAENGLGGSVNPNLYEDGKICLSLLGTWDGDKGEGWSAVRSTLLQVIVSILGLVLVREPYFNEAGYEPLAGLESSRRPSALYSERTFLRAHSFIIKPLIWLQSANGRDRSGVEGLEDVIRWLYLDPAGQKLLHKKIRDVEVVLQRSESDDVEPDGITCMSKGACIPLKRVLARLRELC